MKLKLTEFSTIEDINSGFMAKFPYLKLEFFKKGHGAEEPSAKRDQLNPSINLNTISSNWKTDEIEISPALTVAELEFRMKDLFGWHVQVFRRSGKVWLETTTSDHLTLGELNEIGKEHSTPFEEDKLIDFDYD
ncbi:MAG: hypothetical protein IPN13_21795 [Bacteroidetes bacterium]|nr:hypothetical protein [Bacteroidota bacterium]MBK7388287.1 hypothetical protein [Bacteroidota bacterium]MBK8876369.1 hypothetical protein [Bacteroidota bacterium]MBK9423541.1 hypothetical protein [Bacteroidota bacterium]MBL0071208.1 hypothetical protein [Bacteroidota bacterium]